MKDDNNKQASMMLFPHGGVVHGQRCPFVGFMMGGKHPEQTRCQLVTGHAGDHVGGIEENTMNKTNDDGPAFSQSPPGVGQDMSLRDWFAGQVLPSLLRLNVNARGDDAFTRQLFAEEAYALADAMLKARTLKNQ